MPPILLATLAGAATLIGAAMALGRRTMHPALLALALSFAAGAMVLVSVVELLPEAVSLSGVPVAVGGALVALGAIAGAERGLKRFMPESAATRAGVLMAAAIALHNLPEGAATVLASEAGHGSAAVLALAIGIHNVPEGLAVAAPLAAAGVSRLRVVGIALVAALAEPAGALAALAAGQAFAAPQVTGAMLAGVAAVMLYVSVRELLPNALRLARIPGWAGTAMGSATMAASLLLVS